MSAVVDILAGTGRFSSGYAELLVKGVEASIVGRKPVNDRGGVIDTNHPMFVFGHLGLYPARVVHLVGGDGSALRPPEGWEVLFKAGAACVDDREGTRYPAWNAVTEHFFRATEGALQVVRATQESAVCVPHPDEKARQRFPTIAHMLNFYLTGHVMMHLGQVSAWRRCMGLPSAM